MDFRELLEKIREKYLERDRRSGRLFLLAVLMEEVGELAEAVRKGELKEVEEEVADVMFMTICIANLFGLNPEEKIIEKYVENDPSYRWDLP